MRTPIASPDRPVAPTQNPSTPPACGAPVSRRQWLRAAAFAPALRPPAPPPPAPKPRAAPPMGSSDPRPPRPAALRTAPTPTWDVQADADPGGLLAKLINRTTMGFSISDLVLANQLGYQGYLDAQLAYTAIDDSVIDLRLAPLTTLKMTPFQLWAESSALIISELTQSTLLRSVFSKRQLFERAVEFWTDHFNIDSTKDDCAFLKTIDDASVIRRYALNKFPQLLTASVQSPAMLIYLDNYVSTRLKPNENYARELLELHTMGSDAGYTQEDVENVARCFTGWTVYDRGAAPQLTGTFKFVVTNHDQSQKTVLGNVIAGGGGLADGFKVIQILAEHPATARFIARKITRWLLGDGAPGRVIDDVAATYTATGGDIKAMIRTALTPNYLYSAPPRYKRPRHHFISALRALSSQVQGTWNLEQLLIGAGQLPFRWTTPDGYPDTVDYWGGLLVNRWNFGASLTEGQIPGLVLDLPAFFGAQREPQAVVDKLDSFMFAGEMPAADKLRLRTYLEQYPQDMPLIRDAVGMAIGSPAFQWY